MPPMLFLLCACWVALATALNAKPYDLEDAELHFERFIEQYNKQYLNEAEKQIRFEIFKANLESVNKMNEKSDHAVFGITKFLDLTLEEFVSTYTGLRTSLNDNDDDCDILFDGDIPHVDAPASFDWREHGVVTHVKNQKECLSCYAFADIANIEGQYALKYGKLQEFSEQQIVDCDGEYGCHGGIPSKSLRDLVEMGGVMTEADYPYAGERYSCHFDQSKVKVKLSGCHRYNLTSQEKVKQLLYKTGPIAIAVVGEGFHAHEKGIINDMFCANNTVDHAVLLVGYGTEDGKDYWTVKNSWGENAGEGGYYRLQRGEGASSCKMMNDRMATSIIL